MMQISHFFEVFCSSIWIKRIFGEIMKKICRGGPAGPPPVPKNWFVGAGGGLANPYKYFFTIPPKICFIQKDSKIHDKILKILP